MSADRFRFVARLAVLAMLPAALGACDWFTDFKDQPSIRYWESAGNDSLPTRSNPTYSVPTTGQMVPAYVVSYARNQATLDSMSALLRNPTPMSEESLRNGRMQYQINCSVCHGPAGRGNGPVAQFGFPAFPLTTELTMNRTDGYIFGIIRNGGNIMPPYNRIEEMDRWDIVNYVRALQGRAAGFTVDTMPFGTPGQTGAAVPGATQRGPTRPVPFYAPDSIRRAGSPTPGAVTPPPAGQPGGRP